MMANEQFGDAGREVVIEEDSRACNFSSLFL